MMIMIMVLMTIMEMNVILNWIKITNYRADSTKVDFSDGVCSSSHFKLSHLCPGVCRWTEEKHLISVVFLIIPSTGHHQLLVEETSFETVQCPGKVSSCCP